MNFGQDKALQKLLTRSFPILKWLMIFVLVLNLGSCGEKAVSQDTSIIYPKKSPQISQNSWQFLEVPPPDVIQELRPNLDFYQPQVAILEPQSDVVLQDNTVSVRLQVKDLPIFKDPQLQLGPHLHLILDNQPYIAVYDLNQPVILPDLLPGTHTLRVFASRPWHESFKNEGAYAQTTFHIFTKTDENNPDPSLPLLTFSRPKDSYGAEPILLDFYLTNAPLQLLGEDDSEDEINDWRIRCTINGESFIFDSWQAVYLKGFKPGKNWIKLEFLDNQGNPVKNAFNTTARVFTYEPEGKDTLARIVRGELTAEEVRGIVDQNYAPKIPVAQPTPTPTVEATPESESKIEKQLIPETEVPEVPATPAVTPTPVEELPTAPEVTPSPAPAVTPTPVEELPTAPEVTPSPTPAVTPTPVEELPTAPEVTPSPTPAVTPTPVEELPATPEVTPSPAPAVTPTLVEELPTAPEVTPSPTPAVTPTPVEELPATPETSVKPKKAAD